jgi:hypothetical protein
MENSKSTKTEKGVTEEEQSQEQVRTCNIHKKPS